MFPERGTQKDGLRECFEYIERDALLRLNTSGMKPSRLYSYGELAALSYHPEEDWKHDGSVRRILYGTEGRMWLVTNFRLWFKADEEAHTGLLFTADPGLGMHWFYDNKLKELHRIARALLELSEEATRRKPSLRHYFQKINRAGRHVQSGAEKGDELRSPAYLRLIGIPEERRDDEQSH